MADAAQSGTQFHAIRVLKELDELLASLATAEARHDPERRR